METSTEQRADVAIIGAGAIGLAVAWRAAQRGLRPVVVDRGEPGAGATRVAAGMLAAVAEADPNSPALLAFANAAARGWPSFAGELSEAAGRDAGYLHCGALAVARDRDEAEQLERSARLRERLGLTVERLLPSEARRREPALAPVVRLAVAMHDDHAVDPRALVPALVEAVRRAGGELRARAGDARVAVDGGSVAGVQLADGELLAARRVVVAAGSWSASVGGVEPAARIPVRPVKGQILRFHDPAGPGLVRRVIHTPGGYLVPRGDGRYVFGATVEERGFDTTLTAGGAFELLRDAIEVVPGVSELVVDEAIAGLRPGTPDNAPAIGPGALRGLHWATGHYRNGILLAPLTAEIVAAQLAGESPPYPELAEPLSPDRFSAAAGMARPAVAAAGDGGPSAAAAGGAGR